VLSYTHGPVLVIDSVLLIIVFQQILLDVSVDLFDQSGSMLTLLVNSYMHLFFVEF